MTLIFDHSELETRVRAMARRQGGTLAESARAVIRERVALPGKPKFTPDERDVLVSALLAEARNEPILDDRTPDEIIGYNEYGVPE